MQPAGHSPLPEFPPFDAVALADWLSAPVATLTMPPGHLHYGHTQSHSVGHDAQIPLAVTVEHRYDSANHLDPGPAVTAHVRTRLRQARGETTPTTAQANIAEALRDYLETNAGRAGIPLAPSRRPDELDTHLSTGLGGWSWRDVLIEDVHVQWQCVMSTEYGTRTEVTAIGGNLGNTLIAVAGPARLLDHIALRTWPPTISTVQ